jgi:hypothetical protein
MTSGYYFSQARRLHLCEIPETLARLDLKVFCAFTKVDKKSLSHTCNASPSFLKKWPMPGIFKLLHCGIKSSRPDITIILLKFAEGFVERL